MRKTITVELSVPIQFTESEKITVLEFKSPTLGELELLDGVMGNIAQLHAMISICTGLDLPRVKKISSDDLEAITGALGKLMPAGQQIGAT